MKKSSFINSRMTPAILIIILATGIFVYQTDLTTPVSAEKAVSEKEFSGQAAIEYLKQTGGYDSLKSSFEAISSSENGNFTSQSPAATEIQKLTAPDGAMNDRFGGTVAVSGNTALISSHYEGGTIPLHGSVYVFIRNGSNWTFQQKLFASDRASGDLFGWSVAISGDTVIIGAIRDNIGANNSQGSAYIFVRNGTTWTEQQKLTASDGETNDNFGTGVGISGNTAIVGAARDDNGGNTDQGSAYIFVRNGTTWTQQQKLSDINGGLEDRFGWSVAIEGETVIIGADSDNSLTGSASVYTRTGTTWTLQQLLTANDNPNSVFFGWSVAISGETVVIGAFATDSSKGAAYVFVRNGATWTRQQKLTAADGVAGDRFGSSVAISGETVVVGSPISRIGANFAQGAAYTFTRSGTTWTQQQKLTASDGASEDQLSYSVGISNGMVIAGADFNNAGTVSDQGSAYVFTTNSTPTVPRPFDFDGDGKTDISIFRPSAGEWWYLRSSNGTNFAAQFGTSSDKIVPGDYTGDGKADFAFFRPSTGQWFVLRSEDFSFYAFPFGTGTDTPVPADYDGDGKTDAAVFRSSINTWFIQKSSGGTDIIGFGASGDKPIPADYDGDGKADIAIYRPTGASGAEWWMRRSSNLSVFALTFGTATDKPVQGDYTGDGKADIAFFRPAAGNNWFILRSEDFSFYAFQFGISSDIPTPGDYDGDGKADAGVFRPSSSTWFIQRSTAGVLIQGFGIAGDQPVPNAFVP